MNTKNNKRRRESQESIEKTFIELLQKNEISEISVSDICKLTGLNRSTFYANYIDIYDLADTLRDKLENEVASLYDIITASVSSSKDWITLFTHIKDNQLFYKTYFKLGYDSAHEVNISMLAQNYKELPEKELGYHVEFFRAGFNAIVKKWLAGGCIESPEAMNDVLVNEYKGRTK